MSSYSIGLFLHVLAAAGIFAGAAIQVSAGFRVRSATTGRELASWAGFARSAGIVIALSAVVSLLTGGHLAGVVYGDSDVNGFTVPFVLYGIAGWFLLLPIGPMIGGPRLKRLATEGEGIADAPLTPAILAEARSGSLWGAVHSLVGVAAAYVWIMEVQPGHLHTAVALLLGLVLGWAAGAVLAGRSAPSGGYPTVPGPAVTPPDASR